jgi:amino acid permease
MIAIGGSIGSGLFIGSGGALATGGPAFLITGIISQISLK